MLGKAVEAAQVLQGFITVSKYLDEAQKVFDDYFHRQCVREANNNVYDDLFGKGRALPDSECEKEPVVRDKLAPTWRRHLAWLRAITALARVGAVHSLVVRPYEERRPVLNDCEFREALQAVGVSGGVAGNVVPDAAEVTVNHRFAPDRSIDEAVGRVECLRQRTTGDPRAAARLARSSALLITGRYHPAVFAAPAY